MRLPAPNPDVMYREVDDGAVLLSPKDEVYYGLNAVGSYIWEHLSPVLQTLDDLSDSLGARYPDVPAETIRADARALLNDLLTHGLVSPANESYAAQEADQAASPRLG
jgi:hypothetical protein